MRILVVGAAGRTGRHIVDRAIGHGHKVTAMIHQTPLGVEDEALVSVTGDVRDLDFVRTAMAGNNAVAFAISQSSGDAHIHEQGIANVIYAMAEDMATRLAVVSAAGTFARTDKKLPMAYRAMVATTMRAVYDDLEAMERRVMASDLDWTIVRPVGLTDEPPSGRYRVSLDGSLLAKSTRVSRADVASLVVKSLETDTYWRRAVVVGG